jgi:hypothetical protein
VTPHGCPVRRVKEIHTLARGAGVVDALMTLECGHSRWHFAMNPMLIPMVLPCLDGPCYRYGKAMGINC